MRPPLCVVLLALLPRPGWAIDELALKAAVAYKLLLFTEWPAAALPAGSPLRLCTPAAGPYVEPLRDLRGQKVADHPLEIVELAPEIPSRPCHALLLDGSGAAPAQWLLQQAEGQPTLVIADELPGAPGVAVRVSLREGRVGFDVDLAQVRRRGLRLSAQLLRLARHVLE